MLNTFFLKGSRESEREEKNSWEVSRDLRNDPQESKLFPNKLVGFVPGSYQHIYILYPLFFIFMNYIIFEVLENTWSDQDLHMHIHHLCQISLKKKSSEFNPWALCDSCCFWSLDH